MCAGQWASAPYLLEDSAASLRWVLSTAHPGGQLGGGVTALLTAEIDQLIECLLQIEAP